MLLKSVETKRRKLVPLAQDLIDKEEVTQGGDVAAGRDEELNASREIPQAIVKS